MRAPLALVTVALLLAGCASDAAEPPAPSPTPSTPPAEDAPAPAEEAAVDAAEAEAPAPHVATTFANGSITSVGLGNAEGVSVCCPTLVVAGEGIEGTFAVDDPPEAILVELAWQDATFDLDLWLYAPDHQTVFPPEANGTSITSSRGHVWFDHRGQLGSPDGRVALLVEDPEALALTGEWGWQVTAKSSNAVAFRVAVSVFHGAPPAEGYTALGA